MSKLFKLKEWLIVSDAAKRLSDIFEEEVSEDDVFRFALDGHLKLSVNFVNHAKAKRGYVVTMEGTEWYRDRHINWPIANEVKDTSIYPKIPSLEKLYDEMSAEEKEKEKVQQTCIMSSLNIDGERFINLDKDITAIQGVWDLSMIGNELLDVENIYQDLTDGPSVTLKKFLTGCYVERTKGEVYELQDSYNYYEGDFKIDQPGSKAHLAWLETVGEEKLGKSETERQLNQHEEERKKFISDKATEISYYPADELPQDIVFVVRTNALREFEQLVADSDEKGTEKLQSNNAKPESTRKTENLLRTLAAVAIDAYGYDPISAKSTVPQDIVDALNDQGVELDPKTIRNYLKDGVAFLPPDRKKD